MHLVSVKKNIGTLEVFSMCFDQKRSYYVLSILSSDTTSSSRMNVFQRFEKTAFALSYFWYWNMYMKYRDVAKNELTGDVKIFI